MYFSFCSIINTLWRNDLWSWERINLRRVKVFQGLRRRKFLCCRTGILGEVTQVWLPKGCPLFLWCPPPLTPGNDSRVAAMPRKRNPECVGLGGGIGWWLLERAEVQVDGGDEAVMCYNKWIKTPKWIIRHALWHCLKASVSTPW